MPGDLTGVDLKIKRAKVHFADLEALWRGFLKAHPYEWVRENDPQTGESGLRLKQAQPLPLCVPVLAGDLIHNLRSALDQLVWQLVKANGGEPEENPSAHSFTVWDLEAKCQTGFPGGAAGVSKAALKFLKGLKPYKGGNDALWAIHYLDIVDKHRMMVTTAVSHGILATGEHWVWGDKSDPTTFETVHATPETPLLYAPQNMVTLEPGAWFNVGDDMEPVPLILLRASKRPTGLVGFGV